MSQKASYGVKICITASGDNLDTFLDPRFGRAEFFLIVDEKGSLIKAIKNAGMQAMRGAGITAAQIVLEERVNAVITGNIGPNASMVLSGSRVKIFLGKPSMSARQNFQEYQKGKIEEARKAVPYYGPGFGPGPGQRRRGFRGRGRGRR